ncbi:multidrug effflux MFS transporter [Halovulum dunhuangense]|uniref:Bcr/CflA family efflux transporter n=1 Tax=Halovulum dunhuangense TaxID=1505036 RepID=A0A849L504_9RHOB|nr:multidrug effflux MFS transporter [Halovulum dunhuangense]
MPLILAGCTAISVLSTDLITPSIPDLPEAFGTSISLAQMTVGVNLAAYALAQLVHGPVADAIGRRMLLVLAFVVFAGFSVFCALAPNIETLLAGRFLQGLASSVPSVVIILIIRELYDPQKALKVMALYGATLGVAPAAGPLIGGYLHVWFGWSAGFWLIAALALGVGLLVWLVVPESLAQRRPFRPGASVSAYGALLKSPGYMGAALGVSLMFGAFYAYITTAPVVFIEIMGLPTERYGLTHLAIIAAFILGNILASRASANRDACALLRLAALGMVMAMVVLVVPIAVGLLSIPLVLGAMALYGICLALVLAAGPLVVLNAAGDAPQGPASALLGSLQLSAAALAGALSAHFYDHTALPMTLVMAGLVATGSVLVWRSCAGAVSRAARVSGPAD